MLFRARCRIASWLRRGANLFDPLNNGPRPQRLTAEERDALAAAVTIAAELRSEIQASWAEYLASTPWGRSFANAKDVPDDFDERYPRHYGKGAVPADAK